jgi:hypothetical protein
MPFRVTDELASETYTTGTPELKIHCFTRAASGVMFTVVAPDAFRVPG